MKKADLGKFKKGGKFSVNLERLIETRMQLTASSGGGKSSALRLIVEGAYGKKQIIIIDTEGEFSTLRPLYDFLILGKEGDVKFDPRRGAAYALKFLELGSNVVIDLSELDLKDKQAFVRDFFQAMLKADRKLWRDLLLVLDEAHEFAPEKSPAVSSNAVIAMASKGRKRGFALLMATQRPAKLSKDASAECQNKIIGLQNLPDDRKRGAEELGFTSKEEILTLRDMDPGQFYACGPAFLYRGGQRLRGVERVVMALPETRPPKRGQRRSYKLTASKKLKAELAKLADLPKEAEQQDQDMATLKAKVRELEGQLRAKPQISPLPISNLVAAPTLKQMKNFSDEGKAAGKRLAEKALKVAVIKFKDGIAEAWDKAIYELTKEFKQPLEALKFNFDTAYLAAPKPPEKAPQRPAPRSAKAPAAASSGEIDNNQQKILNTIAMLVARGFDPNREMVARWMGIHPTGGRYGSNLAILREMGLVEERGTKLTEAGNAAAQLLPTGFDEFRKVLDGTRQQIVDVLERDRNAEFTRETLAAALNLHPTGGRYGSNLALLRAMGAIPDRGTILLVPEIFN